jgi:hypothetical protein
MKALRITIPHQALMECRIAALMLCNFISEALPAFQAPLLCCIEALNDTERHNQWAEIKAALGAVGAYGFRFITLPECDGQFVVYFG